MKISVSAGPHLRRNAVCAVRPAELEPGNYTLTPEKGAAIPATVLPDGNLCFVLDYLGTNETVVFDLAKADGAPRMAVEKTDRGVTVTDGGAFLTEYYTGTDLAKPYLGPLRERYGADVTRLDFACREHPHHRSLWVSHGSVNGVDTWNEPENTHGYIRNRELKNLACGSAAAAFTAVNTWTDHSGNPLLTETTAYTIYATGADNTVIDVAITLTADYGDVTLGATKEAGPLAVRMAENIKVKNTGTMRSGVGGVNEDEIWMKRAPWVDYFGTVENRCCGVAMLDHPSNEMYPSYWHARDYGLMAVNNFYRGGEKPIPAGGEKKFLYRVVIHNGNTEIAGIPAMFADFAAPVTVKAADGE